MLRSAVVVGSPKVLQAMIASLGDWYTWQLAVNIFGPDSNASFFAVRLHGCHMSIPVLVNLSNTTLALSPALQRLAMVLLYPHLF